MTFNQIKVGSEYAYKEPTTERPPVRVLVVEKTQTIYGTSGKESRRAARVQRFDPKTGDYSDTFNIDADCLVGDWRRHALLVAEHEANLKRKNVLSKKQEERRWEHARALEDAGFIVKYTQRWKYQKGHRVEGDVEPEGYGAELRIEIPGFPVRFEELPEDEKKELL